MAFTEALKPKGSSHLSTLVDADGRLIQAETRNDELQKIRYNEIIALLIEAGYYRAKIKGLSEFDKVVGGMTWCIEICDVDLDIDLLFQENSTIGQKIALTEKIVAVLPKMKCPHSIEPHQIQGLDFIHIYPVIEWLVKRSNENREERGDYLRSYAVHQFDKHYSFPDEKANPVIVERMVENIKNLQGSYGPQRKYKRIAEEHPKDQWSQIEATLFEYGHVPVQFDDETNEHSKEELVDEARIEELSKTMTAVTNARLGAGTVTSLVEKSAPEVTAIVEKFSKLKFEDGGSRELHFLLEKAEKLKEEEKKLQGEIKLAQQEYDEAVSATEDYVPDSKLPPEHAKEIMHLESLLLILDQLKSHEEQFKQQCKIERSSLEDMIRSCSTGEDSNETSSLKEEWSLVEAELAETRLRLARVTRGAASVHRLIDQVPSRAELNQYQKRFLELYNHVSAKHRETKQYYTLYNSLSDQNQYLKKELSLLNSILESYKEAMQSAPAKEQFMKQFEAIVDGIKQNKAKVEQKRNEEREAKEKLKSRLQALLDQQRLYAIALREFTEECQLNESLLLRIKKLSAPG